MAGAQGALDSALDQAKSQMQAPCTTVWMNASATAMRPGCNPQEIVDNLKYQFAHTVQWKAIVENILSEGIQEVYEVGPKKTVTDGLKKFNNKVLDNAKN